MYEGKTRKIAFSGISITLIILSLYSGTIVINNKIFFTAFAIAIAFIPYIIGGIRYGITAYAASSLLALILVHNVLLVGVYIIFGIYPLIKLIAERNSFLLNYLIKFLWFNISIGLAYVIFNKLIYINEFFMTLNGKILVALGAQIFFLVFDYFFNICIDFFLSRILKRLK